MGQVDYMVSRTGEIQSFALEPPTFWRATRVLTRRWVWRLQREPVGFVAALVGPIFWLLLFGHLFSETVTGVGGDYISFITAGVMAMTVYGGAWDGGIDVLFDREAGIMQRILSAPIAPWSVIASRLIFVLALTVIQCILLLLTARLQGVEIAGGLPGLIVVLVTGVLLGGGIACLSIALAFGLSGHTQFFSISSVLSLPLIFLSNALVPLDQMPAWLRAIAAVNPLTYAISLMREVILAGIDWRLAGTTFGVLGLFSALALALAAGSMGRSGRGGYAA